MSPIQTIPVGEVTRIMERGQVTIPAKYRKKLGLTTDVPLNIFEWKGMVVIAPVELKLKTFKGGNKAPDWVKDTPQAYLKKVRYNSLEELWLKMARKR